MKRKEDPEQYCAYKSCGKRLVRKHYEWGLEDHCHFVKRRFCDRVCGVKGRRSRSSYARNSGAVKFVVRLLPDEIGALRIIAGRDHHGDLDRAIGALAKAATGATEQERGDTGNTVAWNGATTGDTCGDLGPHEPDEDGMRCERCGDVRAPPTEQERSEADDRGRADGHTTMCAEDPGNDDGCPQCHPEEAGQERAAAGDGPRPRCSLRSR